MGKFLKRFKEKTSGVVQGAANYVEKKQNTPGGYNSNKIKPQKQEGMDGFVGEEEVLPEGDNISQEEDNFNVDYDDYGDYGGRGGYDDDVGIQPAQKPESFHHFILENQYKDLERSIRGLKDVFEKETQSWKTKRKRLHCFTDEEAEDILRTAQSHLATDIKLATWNADNFGILMMAIYSQLDELFVSISEYSYGRYKDYEEQYKMKRQNLKIFLELWARVQANYSRGIAGKENVATHGSVRGQESLQSTDRDISGNNRGYS